MKRFSEMTQEERKMYVEEMRKEEAAAKERARKEYVKRANDLAVIEDFTADILQKGLDMLKDQDGKQWTKRVADYVGASIPEIHVCKAESFGFNFIKFYFHQKFPRFSYNETEAGIRIIIDNSGRVDYAKTLEHNEGSVTVHKRNAENYRRTGKDLIKCIKAAQKLNEQIKEYSDKFDYYTRNFDECRITNKFLLH